MAKEVPEFDSLELNADFRLNIVPRTELDDFETKIETDYKSIREKVSTRLNQRFAVLGIDIYRYSDYEELEQVLVPRLFDELYIQTSHMIAQGLTFVFQPHVDRTNQFPQNRFRDFFIGTGDGGFQIFENPLQAALFLIEFEAIVRLYNTRHFMSRIFDLIGPITLRYSVTYDGLYHHGSSYFGPAIINNARILSKDHLNRLIIDSGTFDWFHKHCLGVENLASMTLRDVAAIEDFQTYDHKDLTQELNDLIFYEPEQGQSEGIKFVIVQKLGFLESKRARIEVYNVSIQARVRFGHFMQQRQLEFTFSVGNMNAQGLISENA